MEGKRYIGNQNAMEPNRRHSKVFLEAFVAKFVDINWWNSVTVEVWNFDGLLRHGNKVLRNKRNFVE